MIFNDLSLDSPQEIVDSFMTFVQFTYINFSLNFESNICDMSCVPTLNISETDVLLALKRLKLKSSIGPDGIPAFFS